ncbi:hypothetical protein [Histidinibacterium lentulum]|uniref:DUF2029 domain-containing protein n=1 Tax=Histidinibacterium lentulum TaxID=2480588 RepID=A0A3N2QUS7_9RHOB|nr:hypothetical protein [Histidinibacterium lentulum]ROT98963.1 hypothetical protein EAT49_15150 [Histidinibacterium lentulum]
MFRPNSILLAGAVLAMLALLGGAALLKGGLYIGMHEGDTIHLMDIVLRTAGGQWPHLDFSTPIGPLAFAPIALFSAAGLGIGMSILWGQVLMAAALAPAVWWVAATRMDRGPAFLFVVYVMILVLALIHGEDEASVSISMHYNRWSWALAYLAIAAAVLPPMDKGTGTVDGLIVGLAMAALALMKVSYFVAFAIPVALGLILTGQRRALVVALIAGLAAAALLTVLAGPGYWLAYMADLREVAGSTTRPQPGLPLRDVISGPLYLGASLTALAAVVFLRQAGAETGGLMVLLLLPGFFYVTFQNFGNDPQWLILLAVLLLALKPAGGGEGRNGFGLTHKAALGGAAAVSLAFAAPSFFNLAWSPFRHYTTEAQTFVPVLPRGGINADLLTLEARALRTDITVPVDAPALGLAAFREEERREHAIVFLGETRAYCELSSGLVAVFDAVARDLEEAGYGGRHVFTADLFNPYWLYGDLAPLPGGAPWNYGNLAGFERAEFLMVPTCPIAPRMQSPILAALVERGTDDLTEVRRTALYTLYRIGEAELPPSAGPQAEAIPDALPEAALEAGDAEAEEEIDPDAARAIDALIDRAIEEPSP